MDTEKICDEMNLPRRSTNEENIGYIKSYTNGNKAAIKCLINGNLRLIVSIIYREYSFIDVDIYDLISVGIMGLEKAIKVYKPDDSNYFSIYAGTYIYKELSSYIQSKRKENLEIEESLDTIDEYNKEGALSYLNMPLETLCEECDYEELRSLLCRLSKQEQTIIRKHFGFDGDIMTRDKIAQELGKSNARIYQIEMHSLIKLKGALKTKKNQ